MLLLNNPSPLVTALRQRDDGDGFLGGGGASGRGSAQVRLLPMGVIQVIVNPNARYHRRRPGIVDALKTTLGGSGRVSPTRTVAELEEVADSIAADGSVSVVVLSGGDGTSSHTITALHRAYSRLGRPMPQFALIRGGTMNTTANGLGIRRGHPMKLLSRFLRAFERI